MERPAQAGPARGLHVLDNRNLYAVGTLLTAIALGPEAIDHWLEEEGAEDCPSCGGPGVLVRGADGSLRRVGTGQGGVAIDCPDCRGRGFVPAPQGMAEAPARHTGSVAPDAAGSDALTRVGTPDTSRIPHAGGRRDVTS